MGRVVLTAVWFLPTVPHPVVVWEVVVNTDCGMWSHRDGFPGVVWSGLVWSGLVVSGWDQGIKIHRVLGCIMYNTVLLLIIVLLYWYY